MSRIARSTRLLKNAEAALISAIEIYNKPAFGYREETFAILAINAWELLLKAKVLVLLCYKELSLLRFLAMAGYCEEDGCCSSEDPDCRGHLSTAPDGRGWQTPYSRRL